MDYSCSGQLDDMPFTHRPFEFSLSIMEYGSVMVIIFLETTTWINIKLDILLSIFNQLFIHCVLSVHHAFC